MSTLITDIKEWFQQKVTSFIGVLVSSLVLAFIVYLVVPSHSPSPSLSRSPIHSSNRVSPSQKDIDKLKLQLIFRTNADLAHKLGLQSQDISLTSVTNKTWLDNSLECPAPIFDGTALTKTPQRVKIAGWIIAWKVGNIVYEYNTSIHGEWILCSKNEIPDNIAQNRDLTSTHPL